MTDATAAAEDARLPAAVRPLLAQYLGALQERLPGLAAGCWVHGSIAYGAWDEGTSDVDVLVLTTRRCTPADLAALREIHADVARRWPGTWLDASYVEWDERGRLGPGMAPHPFHYRNVFHDAGVFDFNSPRWAAITWWQVLRRGIALAGPEPAALGFDVGRKAIVDESRRLVDSFWADWTRRRAQLSGLRHPWAVDWVVLGLLRTWYTLREGDVVSKRAAAEYGLRHLPARWHGLVRDVLARRGGAPPPGPLARLGLGLRAALFARYMVRECRRSGVSPAASRRSRSPGR